MKNSLFHSRFAISFMLALSIWWPVLSINQTAHAVPFKGGNVLTVSKTAGAAQFTKIGDALRAAMAGDTIEIIDGSIHDESLTIRVENLTLQAREGQTPTLRRTSAVLITVNAQNFTVRRLIFTGGLDGLVTQASGGSKICWSKPAGLKPSRSGASC